MADYSWMTNSTKPKYNDQARMSQASTFNANQQRSTPTQSSTTPSNPWTAQTTSAPQHQAITPTSNAGGMASIASQPRTQSTYGTAGAGYGGTASTAARPPGGYGAPGAGYSTQAPGSSNYNTQWSLPSYTPSNPVYNGFNDSANALQGKPPTSGGGYTPAGLRAGQAPNFGAGYDVSQYTPGSFQDKNEPLSRYIENTIPMAQLNQNAYQYTNDFLEDQARFGATFGQQQILDSHQMGLENRQQMSAEERDRIAAEQWNRQFDWTQQTDAWGYDLGLQDLGVRYDVGMDQNQATRDVAGIYAGAQRYEADQQLAGTLGSASTYANAQRYGADQERLWQMYGADQQRAGQVQSANIYGDAQRYQAQQAAMADMYGADLNLAGTVLSTEAQRYGADQQRLWQMYGSDQQRIAQMYGSDQQLAGTLGSAGLYSDAQRYGADQQFAGTRYQWDTQAAMNQAMMQNNLQVAAMNAYGRNQAPRAQWAMQWA